MGEQDHAKAMSSATYAERCCDQFTALAEHLGRDEVSVDLVKLVVAFQNLVDVIDREECYPNAPGYYNAATQALAGLQK